MSIDRRKVAEAFKEYTDQYDPEDEKIHLKILHTGKVAMISEQIATSIGLSENDVDLAWTIGMLHDIGRFEQVRRFGTFMDKLSVNHAEFGADILFSDGLIANFGSEGMTEEELSLIETSIRQHNRYRIDEGLTGRQKMFCNIIRDADKVDIIRVNVESTPEAIYGVTAEDLETSSITPAVMENFRQEICVSRDLRKTPADFLVGHVSFVFELVYPESVRIAVQQGHIFELLEFRSSNRETAELFKEIGDIMRNNLRNREQEK